MSMSSPSSFSVTRRRRVWHRGVESGLLSAFAAATGAEIMPPGSGPRGGDGEAAIALVNGADETAVRETLRWPVSLWLDAECPWPPLPPLPEPGGWRVVATTATAYRGSFSDGLLAGLAARLRDLPACASREPAMATAVQEVLANAVIHGNLEVSSEMRSSAAGFRRYTDMILARLAEPVYAHRILEVGMCRESRNVVVTVRDQGPGYRSGPSTTRLSPGFFGLGLSLVQDMTDGVDVSDGGRITRLCWSLSGGACRPEAC